LTGLPERIKQLKITLQGGACGSLARESQFVFAYDRDDAAQPAVSYLMPPTKLVYQRGDLFPVMDQNLPEGFLLSQLRGRFPKQQLTPMHLLALMGDNAIGRLGFQSTAGPRPIGAGTMTKEQLLRTKLSATTFKELVDAYLGVGMGVSGMQPKIMIPGRATVPIPNLIVKAGAADYPGICANEYLCLKAAHRAQIPTATAELSDDGQLLVIDRFDIEESGERLGFEDIASLMGLCVRDALSDRKYQGSYEQIADVLKALQMPAVELHRFFEQVAFSIMVRNGDGHLKNFGILYGGAIKGAQLAPMFDVLSTAIYRYQRITGGEDLEDKTLALKLRRGDKTRSYPTTDELIQFGRTACGVARPEQALQRIAAAMVETLHEANTDERIPPALLEQVKSAWAPGLECAAEIRNAKPPGPRRGGSAPL
jgi:serine/threonine-protein kinase HipA